MDKLDSKSVHDDVEGESDEEGGSDFETGHNRLAVGEGIICIQH